MLENKFIDVNKRDPLGVNSFWVACKYGHGQAMRVLAENGADIFCTDEKGMNVLHLAAHKNYVNIA